jgi:hypothetical protein
MMISQPALICLEATWQRLLGRRVVDEVPGGMPAPNLSNVEAIGAANLSANDRPASPLVSSVPVEYMDAKSPPDIAVNPRVDAPLTANERRARAAALRALALSRGRRFDAARAAFTEAARLDPTLDLTRTPAFWKPQSRRIWRQGATAMPRCSVPAFAVRIARRRCAHAMDPRSRHKSSDVRRCGTRLNAGYRGSVDRCRGVPARPRSEGELREEE